MPGTSTTNLTTTNPTLCSHCATFTTKTCTGCTTAPQYHKEATDIYYCSTHCHNADWTNHQILCETRQQRVRLHQDIFLLHQTWTMLREEAWDEDISHVELKRNTLYLYEGEQHRPRRNMTMRRYPDNTEGSPKHKFAVLMAMGCSDSADVLSSLTSALFSGHARFPLRSSPNEDTDDMLELNAKVEEVILSVKNTPLSIRLVDSDGSVDNDEYFHEVLRISLPSGELWCADITGAQFGLPKILWPWHEYKTKYVDEIYIIAPLGTSRHRTHRKISTQSYHDLNMQWLGLADLVEQIVGEEVDALRKVLEEDFENCAVDFIDRVRVRARRYVEELGEPSQRPQRELRWKKMRVQQLATSNHETSG